MNSFEETGGHPLHDIVLCHLLKCDLLFKQGLFEDVVKLAEETYKESIGLGKNLLSIDALMIMALSLLRAYRLGKAFDIIKQGEELLKNLKQELPLEYMQREADIAFAKGWFYEIKRIADRALEHFEHSLALREKIAGKKEIALSLSLIGWVYLLLKGEFEIALEYLKRGLDFAEESNSKWHIAWNLNLMASLYRNTGELNRCILMYEQSFRIFRKLNNKVCMAMVLSNTGEALETRGDLDRALELIEQSMALNREIGKFRRLALNHPILIQILIDKGDFERAQISLHDMEQLNSQLNDKEVNLFFLLTNALAVEKN